VPEIPGCFSNAERGAGYNGMPPVSATKYRHWSISQRTLITPPDAIESRHPLTAHPSNRWMMNANWFQIAMLAYNLNCWLQLFSREESVMVETMKHTTLATARLRFLFLAARIWRHAGRVGVSYSDHYQEKGAFQQLMDHLRKVVRGPDGFAPVLHAPLCA
jgi:hypothetical protein